MQTKTQNRFSKNLEASIPLANYDIFEDGDLLVNRLYYAAPEFKEGRFSCSFFYEDNTYHKEPSGDITLLHSEDVDATLLTEDSSVPELSAAK